MKRKLIQTLLQLPDAQLADEALKLLPAGDDSQAEQARCVLVDAVTKSRTAGQADAGEFYSRVCSSTAAQLATFLKGTDAGKLDRDALARSQSLLTGLLTSKAGRKKSSGLTRQEQLAAAQSRRRDRLGKEGRKQINVWINPEAAAYLDAIQTIHRCDNQAEALELVLEAAMRGEILQRNA